MIYDSAYVAGAGLPRSRACRSRRSTGRIRPPTGGRSGTSATSCPPTGCPAATAQPRPLPAAAGRPDLLSVPVTRMDRTPGASVDQHRGRRARRHLHRRLPGAAGRALVTEWYGPLGAPDRTHALMSVSKSVVGCVAAVLIDRGLLDPDAEITSYVPELAGSGYAGALVRHVYDMRSGVRFGEEYANPDSDISAARRVGRMAARPGRAPRALPVPGHAAGRGAARRAVPVPFGRVRRAGLGVRARGRPAHGRRSSPS